MWMMLVLLMVLMTITLMSTLLTALVRIYEQQRLPNLSAATISSVFREWMAASWAVVCLPFAWFPNRPRPPVGENQYPPVILVPGYGLTRSALWLLAEYLRRRGRWVWAINNPIWRDDIPAFAANLKEKVAILQQRSGAKKVDIIGHSMGGVVAAWYLHHLDGIAHVRRLISLGTPWAGTKMHIFGVGRQCRSLAPGSEILRALPQSIPVPVYAFWSAADAIVLPTKNAWPTWSTPIELDGVGHLEMTMNVGVIQQVGELLAEGDEA